MIRRPPRSTLFPTRRSSDLEGILWPELGSEIFTQHNLRRALERSEEHTSELQSRQYLVCRLLLEKKKSMANGRSPKAYIRGMTACRIASTYSRSDQAETACT